MASNLNSDTPLPASRDEALSLAAPLMLVLRAAASLKVTVVLFLLAIFIVFAGTLAQVNHDIWKVVHEYFRTAIAWIDVQIFFPKSWFPSMPVPSGQYYFPAPGGWLIGSLMVINLVAAHALRFKVQASGARFLGGLGMLGVGVFSTWLVIFSGSKDGLQGVPFFEWSTLWTALQVLLGLSCVGAAVGAAQLGRTHSIERAALAGISLLLGCLLGWLVYRGDEVALTASSMRILWQLLQAEFASLVLLAGCVLLFKKRAGIVLLHSGVGLMMFSELLVGMYAEEAQMHIKEGETVNFAQDIRQLELAVVTPKDATEDDVVAIPESYLRRDKAIHDAGLPFDVEVVQFIQNAHVRPIEPADQKLATAGAGLQLFAEPDRAGTGTDTDSKVDMSAAYVKLFKKGTSDQIGVYLVSLFQSMRDLPERVTVDGKPCDLSLRFKRIYKPYSMHLIDVRFDKYIGTEMAKNYSSDLQLVDPTRNADRQVKIWMNNPLRFAGETFYQSSFNVDPNTGTEITGLQVVSNTGWMIPYVACMIVITGMLAQFLIVLLRFLKRRQASTSTGSDSTAPSSDGFLADNERIIDRNRPAKILRPEVTGSHLDASRIAGNAGDSGASRGWILPLAVVVVCIGWVAGKAPVSKTPQGEMNFYEFGKLPIVFEGREKPIDTLARNMLRIISDKETFVDEAGKTQPAIRWLLDVISAKPSAGPDGTPLAEKHQVFRIENLELLDTLKLPRRNRYRYAIEELRPQIEEFERQAKLAHELKAEQLSVYQRKVLELDRKIRKYTLLLAAFRPPHLPELPTEEEFKRDPNKARAQLTEMQQVISGATQRLRSANPPLAVPVKPVEQAPEGGAKQDAEWKAYAMAWITAFLQTKVMGHDPDPATASWNGMLVSYAKGDAGLFNSDVADYAASLKQAPPPLVNLSKTNFETWFNHMSPFYYTAVLYLIAFVLGHVGWLSESLQKPLNRAAFWLIAATFVFHTAALIGRIYISGRPPVTNLYSSAVFIGWGCVLMSMILESFFKLGIGNVVGAGAGFATLLIAHFLAGDGDTFVVLQAVLDTQFWLATHVTCVTMGYAATFLAGQLGMYYIIRGVLTPTLSEEVAKKQSRMMYGTLCFAIFFSFFGTVLGGLWADDSWGRFWGWDPKENGALIIVLWNALVLHARWDGMVKDRGMAVLAVAGNIATSWSWFGVNELGVGLHSYGFTEGVLMMLGLYVLSQLVVIGLGLLPKSMWWSFRRDQVPSAELA